MFDRVEVKRWRRTVSRELNKIGIPSDDPAFAPGRILAAVYGFGTDVAVLAEVTGYEPMVVRDVLKRCRASKVIVGQSLRVGWNHKRAGGLAIVLDAMIGAGILGRFPDEKRSAAQKTRQPKARTTTTRRPRARIVGAYTPKVVNSDPLYQLAGWKKPKATNEE